MKHCHPICRADEDVECYSEAKRGYDVVMWSCHARVNRTGGV